MTGSDIKTAQFITNAANGFSLLDSSGNLNLATGTRINLANAGDSLAWLGSSTLIGTDDNGNPYLQGEGVQLGFDTDGNLIFNGAILMSTTGFLEALQFQLSGGNTMIDASGNYFGAGQLEALGQIITANGLQVASATSLDASQITTDGGGTLTAFGVNLNFLSVQNSSSLDNGNITTDGFGDVTLYSLTTLGSITNAGVFSSDGGSIITNGTGDITIGGTLNLEYLVKIAQFASGDAPATSLGALYFDTTLNKLRVGGAAGWETITSV